MCGETDGMDDWTDADGAVYMMVQKLPGPPGEECLLAGFTPHSFGFAVVFCFGFFASVEGRKSGEEEDDDEKGKGRGKEERGYGK